MTPHTLASVTERLEAATEGSGELDAAVALTVGWTRSERKDRGAVFWWTPEGSPSDDVPFFTTSLDAAMTLVPTASFWSLLTKGRQAGYEAAVVIGPEHPSLTYHFAATPALAFCIAALRARQARP